MSVKGSDPAFPDTVWDACDEIVRQSSGMSLRDKFAETALNGMLAHSTRYRPRPQDQALHWHDAISTEAYELADAMLKAREMQEGWRE